MTIPFIHLPEERASDYIGWSAGFRADFPGDWVIVRDTRSSKAIAVVKQHTLLCCAFMNTGDTSG